MKLLMVRHGKTKDRLDWKNQGEASDFERPMTPKGRKEFVDIAGKLLPLVGDVHCVVTSPCIRTVQTAEILKDRFKPLQLIESEALLQKSPVELALEIVREYSAQDKTLIIVGHKGHFSKVLSLIVGGGAQAKLAFKKGGCALVKLELGDEVTGELEWILTPKIIKKMV